jgi:phosphohistidine phosphatase
MKRLILLRHAKSSWDHDGLADHDRPLAKRGLRDAPHMGKRLAQHGIAPKLLLTSSAVRARTTAELVIEALGRPDVEIRIEPAIYLASPGQLLDAVASQDDDVGELILVGHNPGMTQLANMLLPEFPLPNLPTAGTVGVDCDCASWSIFDTGPFRLRFYDFPKNRDPVPATGPVN